MNQIQNLFENMDKETADLGKVFAGICLAAVFIAPTAALPLMHLCAVLFFARLLARKKQSH